MQHSIAVVRKLSQLTRLALAVWFVVAFAGCGDTNAGAVGTGNAGRIMGSIQASGAATSGFAVRLLSKSSASGIVDSVWSDSSGVFRFPSEKPGAYWIQVWKNGTLRGESGTFKVDGDVTGLLVILIQGVYQQSLDLSALGEVDSVFVDYPGNQGVKVGGTWRIQTTRDSAFVLHIHLGKNPGRWEEWILTRRDGQNLFINLGDSRSMDFQRTIDTTSFLLAPHTVALWTFDTVLAGSAIPDRSAHGNDLTVSGAARFVRSPHGKAFEQSTGKPLVVGATLPASLRWNTTGSMTYEMRLRLDSLPLTGMVLMGSYGGPRIWVTAFGQIVVENLMSHSAGQSILSVVTGVGRIPVGKWIDLAVSVDGKSNQIYVWVDEQAQPLFKRDEWPTGATLAIGSTEPFCVGGATWDQRPSRFQIDEVRVSDTLVFGTGLELQTSIGLETDGSSIGAGAGLSAKGMTISVCSDCSEVRVGLDASRTTEGFYALKIAVPHAIVGKRIVSGLLCLWSASPGANLETKGYSAHRILENWAPTDPATGWFDTSGKLRPTRTTPVAVSAAPLNAGSSGGLIFDVSGVMQDWADDTASAHGILIRAIDNTVAGDDFTVPGAVNTAGNSAFLKIRYR